MSQRKLHDSTRPGRRKRFNTQEWTNHHKTILRRLFSSLALLSKRTGDDDVGAAMLRCYAEGGLIPDESRRLHLFGRIEDSRLLEGYDSDKGNHGVELRVGMGFLF